MLNIKDACHYSNKLTGWINELQNLMYYKNNYVRITESHLRSKANPEAADEVLETEVERIFTGQIQNIAYLVKKMIEEKLMLNLAIEEAKNDLKIDFSINGKQLTYDGALEYNKKIRYMADNYLRSLTIQKPTKSKTTGRAYKINVEGNQTPYTYDIETNMTLDYDKDVIKDLYKKILTQTDEISTKIDQVQVKEVVNFTPSYDEHDTLEDIVAEYEKTLNK